MGASVASEPLVLVAEIRVAAELQFGCHVGRQPLLETLDDPLGSRGLDHRIVGGSGEAVQRREEILKPLVDLDGMIRPEFLSLRWVHHSSV